MSVGEVARQLSGGELSAAMEQPVRIGLVGAGGNMRARHLPGFAALPGVEVTVVANRFAASAQRVAAEFGIPRVAADWRAVVADPAVDAVCIGTWPYLHAEITCAALAAGKHVLCEARMARDAPEAERMLAAARARTDLVAQVVPSPMTLEVDATICEWISGGKLGSLREICVTHTHAASADANAPLTWRLDRELSGHNTLSLGIWYEAVLRWMQEDVKVEAAQAAVYTPVRRRADGSRARVEIPESLSVLGRYTGGARLVMHLSGVEPGPPRHEVRINGEEGGLRFDAASGELWHAPLSLKQELRVHIAPERSRGWKVEEDFVRSIREGAPVALTSFEDGVRTMRFTDDVWRAWGGP